MEGNVVSELERRQRRNKLTYTLRALTANLLRIANGAGRPGDLATQLAACTAAIDAYDDIQGTLPSEDHFQSILDYEAAWRDYHPGTKDAETERERAMSQIRKGALQMVASMLLDQGAQQRRGEKDIYDGIRLMNEVRS
jgi:hypothetical protein